MRDIVASIQPEQDEIVRAGIDQSVCVQGGPGTGKTAVGLHRAAYLLYAHAAQLRRAGVLVVGPNDAFIRYIGDVLPACYLRLASPEEPVTVRVGVTTVRLQPTEMAKIRQRVLLRNLPYNAGRTAFRNLLVDRLLEITEHSVHNVTR